MKLARVLGWAIVVAAAVVSLAAPSASAATCYIGNMCTFNFRDFNGGRFVNSSNSGSLSSHNNDASSAATNGANCSGTRFYDAAALSGSYMFLNSESLVGSNYRDPNLSNGAGTSTYRAQNWEDRISGWLFTGC